jgi:hypothetical protein
MWEDTKRYIRDVVSTKVENILYSIYFLNHGSLGSIGRTLGDVGKAPKKIVCNVMKNIKKKTSWVLKIIIFQWVKLNLIFLN